MKLAPALLAIAALSLSLPAAAKECRGLKSAHCRCRGVMPAYEPVETDKLLKPSGMAGKELWNYTIPGRCFNQQKDWVDHHLDAGCWKACRDGYGVDGATADPALRAVVAQSSKTLRAAGFCGSWINADSFFAAGTNKWRSNTATGIGVGIGGTVATVDGKKVCK